MHECFITHSPFYDKKISITIPNDKSYYLSLFPQNHIRITKNHNYFDIKYVLREIINGSPDISYLLFSRSFDYLNQYWSIFQKNHELFQNKIIAINMFDKAIKTKNNKMLAMCFDYLEDGIMYPDKEVDEDIENNAEERFADLLSASKVRDCPDKKQIESLISNMMFKIFNEGFIKEEVYTFEEKIIEKNRIIPFNIIKERMIQNFEYFYLTKLLNLYKGNILQASFASDLERRQVYYMLDRNNLRKGIKYGTRSQDTKRQPTNLDQQ